MTEGIMSRKVRLHVVSNNATSRQQAEKGGGGGMGRRGSDGGEAETLS